MRLYVSLHYSLLAVVLSLPASAAPPWGRVPTTEPTYRELPKSVAIGTVFDIAYQATHVAHASSDVSIIDVATGDVRQVVLDADNRVYKLSFSPDRRRLAVFMGNQFGIAVLSDDQDASSLRWTDLASGTAPVTHVVWSSDSSRLFAISDSEKPTVSILLVEPVEQLTTFSLGRRGNRYLSNTDGTVLLAFHNTGVSVWNAEQATIQSVQGNAKWVASAREGNVAAIRSEDGLQIWNLDPLSRGGRIAGPQIREARFSDDGSVLFVSGAGDRGYESATYRVLADGQLALLRTVESFDNANWLSASGQLAACFDSENAFRIMRLFRTDQEATLSLPLYTTKRDSDAADLRPLAFLISENGRRALVQWEEGCLEMFDIKTQLPDWCCRVPDLKHVRLTADGNQVVTINERNQLRIHDTTQGRVSRAFIDLERDVPSREIPGGPNALSFLGDGRHFVARVGNEGKTFAFFDAATGREVNRVVTSQRGSIRTWRVTDDGSTLCVAADQIQTYPTNLTFAPGVRKATGASPFHIVLRVRGEREIYPSIFDARSGQIMLTTKWEYLECKEYSDLGVTSFDGTLIARLDRRLDGGKKGIEVRSTTNGKQVAAIPILTKGDIRGIAFGRDNKSLWTRSKYSVGKVDIGQRLAVDFLTSEERNFGRPGSVSDSITSIVPLTDSEWQTTNFYSIAESDTGWLATGHDRGFVNIWSTKDRRRYAVLRCGTDRVEYLDLSSDGKFLISWRNDRGHVQITDLASVLPAQPPDSKPQASRELDLDF